MDREAVRRCASGTARVASAVLHSRLAFAAVAFLVAVTIVVAVLGTLSLSGRSSTAGSPPAPTAAPTEIAAPTTAPTTAAPADPRSVFQDPSLRALAEPFLAGTAVSCEQREPVGDETERVVCDLGEGYTGQFARLRTADLMRDVRRGLVAGQQAEPGTVRSVRWRYVQGRPAGIPAGQASAGEGVRVRFIDLEGVPRLYFDQDSSGCTGTLALTAPTGNDAADLDALRSFWEDPAP